MALDSKTIKEEILDKDIYEANAIRSKGRTPDSPESVRAVAPRSPISPKVQYTSLALQRTASGSTSPIQKGGSPPQTSSAASTPQAATPILQTDPSKELSKLRKFLGALYQFGQDTSTECGDRVRSLILSLVSGGLSTEAFKQALQESVNFPLRPYVLPFLKSHIPVLKRDLANLAKASNQYIRSNEASVFEFVNASAESSSSDIFMPSEGAKNGNERHQPSNGNSRLLLKRRTSEGVYDHQNPLHEWSDYMHPSKRSHIMMNTSAANGHLFTNYPSLFDYSTAPASHLEPFANSLDKNQNNLREDRDIRSSNNGATSAASVNTLTSSAATSDVHRNNGSVGSTGSSAAASSVVANRGEEEWKNIHTMLNCISAMVDKTKRAITILQQRGVETSSAAQSNPQHADTSMAEIKRQTEEKVAEFRRNAEDAVNQVKRQAVMEIQRAVAAAETRAIEMMAQERIKLEKMFADYHKSATEEVAERLTPPSIGTQNTCWNCGRKANETCSGCNLARYCGSFCQHKDWEQHHQVCGTTVRLDANGHKHATVRNPLVKIPSTRTSPPLTAVQSQQSQLSSSSSSAAASQSVAAVATQQSSSSSIAAVK
ncbi:protein CBFA2T2 isoform X2 [Sitodiplosis mosellana]|uniref:protein CBFA2T2 isoform X2 n=1 Tax=Sitodiplosis mosellana TaxID=263140 RepID=UPI002444C9B8|nr:protein CBFA2T2 isoform X2 [Sitodiplosis mosellana]